MIPLAGTGRVRQEVVRFAGFSVTGLTAVLTLTGYRIRLPINGERRTNQVPRPTFPASTPEQNHRVTVTKETYTWMPGEFSPAIFFVYVAGPQA
jgi:hypothetical protein